MRKKPLSKWLKALLALVLAAVMAYLSLLGLIAGKNRDIIQGEPQVMVILGCQLHEWGPSVLLRDRLDKALEYLEDHPDMIVVVSGGQGPNEPTSEAQGMADYLAEHGVPRENILLEDQSRNTFENLCFSNRVLSDAGIVLKPRPEGVGVIFVSNGFHMARIWMLAGRTGFAEPSILAAPSSHTASRIWMYIREPLALIKSFLFDR